MKIDYYDNGINSAYINEVENELIILNNYNCDLYSLLTGKKLLSFSNGYNGFSSWLVSQDVKTVNNIFSVGGGLMKIYYYQFCYTVPTFEDIVAANKSISLGRKLTEEDRQNCGLSIFDESYE